MRAKRMFLVVATVASSMALMGLRESETTLWEAYAEAGCGKCYQGQLEGEPLDPQAQDHSAGVPFTPNEAPATTGLSIRPGGEDYAHVFADLGWWYSYYYASCTACNSCHSNSQEGACSTYHCACEGGQLDHLADTVGMVVLTGDAAKIRALLVSQPDFVSFDERTAELVISGCDMRDFRRFSVVPAVARRLSPPAQTVRSQSISGSKT
jgi:hypothetical protein